MSHILQHAINKTGFSKKEIIFLIWRKVGFKHSQLDLSVKLLVSAMRSMQLFVIRLVEKNMYHASQQKGGNIAVALLN